MEKRFRETILLDNDTYHLNTNQWDVPILRLDNCKVVSLHINGKEIPSNKYAVKKNHLILSENPLLDQQTVAHLVVEFSGAGTNTAFWLPIILAVIGLIGTVSQPILHYLNLIYKPSRILHIDNTAYEYSPHRLKGEVTIYPINERLFRKNSFIPEEELENWDLYIAATVESNVLDPFKQTYPYFSGPHKLEVNYPMAFDVLTDSAFTNELFENNRSVFKIIALVKKGTFIATNGSFSPSSIKDGDVKIISKAYYYPCEKMVRY